MGFKIATWMKARLNALTDVKLVGQLGWMTGAEGLIRVTRLITTMTLARLFTPEIFGEAAIALTVFEIIRLFNENGLGAAVVRASDKQLHGVARLAQRLTWLVAFGLFVVQALAGIIAARLTGRAELAWLIITLAGVYLIMPAGCVHAWILMRGEAVKRLAGVNAAQLIVDNALTLVLALTGFEVWAIVLPKLLTAPIWLIGVRWGRPWRPDGHRTLAPLGPLLSFCLPVLASELIAGLRHHGDKLLIAMMFGLEAAGLYFFAFNAGVGLSSAVITAFNRVIYPRYCAASHEAGGLSGCYDSVLTQFGPVFCLVFMAQALAAICYVPIIFGTAWQSAIPLVCVLCLTGTARIYTDASLLALRAIGAARAELISAASLTVMSALGLLTGARFGLLGSTLGYLAALIISALVIMIITRSQLHPTPKPVCPEGVL